MKKMTKSFAVAVLMLAALALVGCADGNSDVLYLQAEHAKLRAELAALQSEHNALLAEFTALQTLSNLLLDSGDTIERWEYTGFSLPRIIPLVICLR